MQYEIITRQHRRREETERFICERYWFSFKACLTSLPDTLLAVTAQGQLVAACGLQFAEQQPLFSEYYLHHPIEKLSIDANTLVGRHQIAEVSSMATTSATYLQPLFAAIVAVLQDLERTLVVFTATGYLKRSLERSGIQLKHLADATISALPEQLQGLWGDYYRHQPMVLAGWVEQGVGRFPAAQASAESAQNESSSHSFGMGALAC